MSEYMDDLEREADGERERLSNDKDDRMNTFDRNYEDEIRLLLIAARDVIDAAKYVQWPHVDEGDYDPAAGFLLAVKSSVRRLESAVFFQGQK